MHPKRKVGDLSEVEIQTTLDAVRQVLADIAAQSEWNPERGLFSERCGYKTALSRRTVGTPVKRAASLSASCCTWVVISVSVRNVRVCRRCVRETEGDDDFVSTGG